MLVIIAGIVILIFILWAIFATVKFMLKAAGFLILIGILLCLGGVSCFL